MRIEKPLWACVSIVAVLGCVCLFPDRPATTLSRAEAELNHVYKKYRPFPYRWKDAPLGSPAVHQCSALYKEVAKAESYLAEEQQKNSQTARVLQLSGRLELLAGHFDKAIVEYRRALGLVPDDSGLQLELAIAYAMRAKCESRPLDYEYAMEQMLAIKQATPESAFDLALVYSEVPLPEAANAQWENAIRLEQSARWRREIEQKRSDVQHQLQDWRDRFRALTSSPGSYLVYADQATPDIELVLVEALQDWLSHYREDQLARAALDHIATVLAEHYRDPWLSALLQTPSTQMGNAALGELASAIRENNKGNHIRAEVHAKIARSLFDQVRNRAGFLRARLELVYSLDRQWRQEECLNQARGLREESESLQYRWIGAQSWLEQITCQTETRQLEVIQERERAYDSIKQTGYENLTLRASSFLTEAEVSADRRLRIWNYGYSGLHSFWNSSMPVNRAYTFYYTLGSSARSAGNKRAALALLQEGVDILEETPYRQLFALALSDLGGWQSEQGLQPQAMKTFARMNHIFDNLQMKEVREFRCMAEATRAEIDLTNGDPEAALGRLRSCMDRPEPLYPSLSPTERRRLLPVIGQTFLKRGDLDRAKEIFLQMISENRRNLSAVHDRAQRDNFQREIEGAWKGLTETYLEKHDWRTALSTWEAFRGGWFRDPYPQAIKTPRGVALLTYAFLHGRLSAWIIDDTGTEQRWIARSYVVAQWSKKFAILAADKDSPLAEVTALGKELYSTLLKPFEDHLKQQQLLVIDADGPLAGIPWAALEDSRGQTLIEKIAFSQVIGWAEVSKRFEHRAVDFFHAFIIGNPTLTSDLRRDFPSLPDAQREAEWLSRMLPGAGFIKRQEATQEGLIESLPRATLFHFAGHGTSNGGFGALLLPTKSGGIEELTAPQIAKLKLSNLDVAVLAACSAGIGEETGVLNLDGLVRSFLEAGTARVVAARWDVSSTETVSIMKEFYQALFQGSRPAEALRQAASIVRRKAAHPYYWAGFQVYGAP